jgi:hypothetical protein
VALLWLGRAIMGAHLLMTDPRGLYPPGASIAQKQQLNGLNFILGVGLIFLFALLFRVGFNFGALWSGDGRSGPHLIMVLLYAQLFVSYLAPNYSRASQHLKSSPVQSVRVLLITRALLMGVLFFGAFATLVE